jgi:hypothetical protein
MDDATEPTPTAEAPAPQARTRITPFQMGVVQQIIRRQPKSKGQLRRALDKTRTKAQRRAATKEDQRKARRRFELQTGRRKQLTITSPMTKESTDGAQPE